MPSLAAKRRIKTITFVIFAIFVGAAAFAYFAGPPSQSPTSFISWFSGNPKAR